MKKISLAIMALAMAVLTIPGCGKDEPKEPEPPEKPASIKVTGVSLDRQTLSMTEGEMANLAATVAPSNATDKSVTRSATPRQWQRSMAMEKSWQ